MTQEEKELLLKDLCARQFYGTKVLGPWKKDGPCELSAIDLTSNRQVRVFEDWCRIEDIKPYLRPLSSMTEEESKEYFSICTGSIRGDMITKIDFYIKHHFDFRLTAEGLSMIEAGLALEAPNGMYDLKNK